MRWQRAWQWRPAKKISGWTFFFVAQYIMWMAMIACSQWLSPDARGNAAAFIIGVLSALLVGKWGRWY